MKLKEIFEEWQLQPAEKRAFKKIAESKLQDLHRSITDPRMMWENNCHTGMSLIDTICLMGESAVDEMLSQPKEK